MGLEGFFDEKRRILHQKTLKNPKKRQKMTLPGGVKNRSKNGPKLVPPYGGVFRRVPWRSLTSCFPLHGFAEFREITYCLVTGGGYPPPGKGKNDLFLRVWEGSKNPHFLTLLGGGFGPWGGHLPHPF